MGIKANTLEAGIVELATSAETVTGTDVVRAVTPAGAAALLTASTASTTVAGIVELATSAETITGTDTARAVTPAGLHAKVASATVIGLVELATSAETITGTDAVRAVTPEGDKAALDAKFAAPPALGSGTPAAVSGTTGTYSGALALGNVAAPSGVADKSHIYSADQAAGNACPHVRTENGGTVKLFTGAALTAADAGTIDGTWGAEEQAIMANLRTRLGEVEARLAAAGLIA